VSGILPIEGVSDDRSVHLALSASDFAASVAPPAGGLFGLPSLIFGDGHRVNWPESVLETAIIALVAIPVLVLTRRLVLRLHYLEEVVRVCSWCRKLDTRTSHGMCPTSLAEQKGSCGGRAEAGGKTVLTGAVPPFPEPRHLV
jgi:hypothetical protein